jgi:hypothetical protein
MITSATIMIFPVLRNAVWVINGISCITWVDTRLATYQNAKLEAHQKEQECPND